MKKFDVPSFYKSSIIGKIKDLRKDKDPRKKNYAPTKLDFGPVQFFIARHFGFCFGVENAIEIAYNAIEENPNKRIFLLSEMIHNPQVNADLISRGVKFIMDTKGGHLISWDDINNNDVIILPAFGTTIEIESKIKEIGIDSIKYNTTCPFVERVWKMSKKLGNGDYSIIIHGKAYHEETKATFSHASSESPSLIIRDLKEAKVLKEIILGLRDKNEFYDFFDGKYSDGFNVEKDLNRIGVVNQTTMLATETAEIANYLKATMLEKYDDEPMKSHFADTRDSLCYATNDNQRSTYELLKTGAHFAIVVGGYNSSNTYNIATLCNEQFNTFFVSGPEKINLKNNCITHLDLENRIEVVTNDFIPINESPLKIIITSGASCPDALVDQIMADFLNMYKDINPINEVLERLEIIL
jgi:4-hydroxy-3-methylbut-2-enyl diphosphate reductase